MRNKTFLDAVSYIKLSLADTQALQFTAEDTVKVLWNKIRATFIDRGEDRKIDAGNELKNILMKNSETVVNYIARTRGYQLRLDVSPRELVYHTVRGLNGKFSEVRETLKTQWEKTMDEILLILREEETAFNLLIKTPSHREEKLCGNTWILDSGASCHMAKESVWFKNISPEVMDIYLADKNSKMMSQGTGNVSAKTVSTTNIVILLILTITNVSYVPQLRCNLQSVTCLMDKGSKYENLTDKRIKKRITDNGLEFVNEQLDTDLANSRIFHEKTLPFNSESNGKAERANRVLLERATSLLYERRRGIMIEYAGERYDIKNQKIIEERSVKFNESLNGRSYLGEIENETWDIDLFFEVSTERNEINQNTENGVSSNLEINNGPVAIENDNSIPLQTTSLPQTGRIQLPVPELIDVQNQIPVRRS
ncbi:retrovirus-related Pol polyprotein from transposon TNT 1-94 [Trichonephila clavipes]|nr:retrovirus-related Pol polyprotein from transposon TNT 1-94 [Trichonephila clavipes]